MCGILGQINRNKSINKEFFSSMLLSLEKRGPDQGGYFYDNNIALGQKRLAVIDTSDNGRQPMANEDKNIILVFNGEIYNYQEIKKNFKASHIWKSQTDSEVLIHAYEEWGLEKTLDKIEGMFAFALFDKNKNKIFLARDHFGKKPLYYYFHENIFCFASELKALLKNPEIKSQLKINDLSLAKFLVYGYIPSPRTIFSKIKKLEPASFLIFDLNDFKITEKKIFWHLENVKIKNDLINNDEIIEKTEELIKKAVAKRATADVPVGIFLSGGIDSGLLAKYLNNICPVESFSVGYKNYLEANELEYSGKISEKLNVKNHRFFLDNTEVKNNFLQMCDYLDEPLADAAIFPLFYLSKMAKQKITVALGGDGGDEIFGGYPKYQAQQLIEKYRHLKFLALIAKNLVFKNSRLYKFFSGFEMEFHQRQFVFGSGGFMPGEMGKIVKMGNLNPEEIFQEAENYAQIFKSKDAINKSLFLDCKMQIPDWYMVKTDRATMANSLEMRSPFLDKNLAEFIFSLPGSYKIKNGRGKWILKKLTEKYFGREFAYRKKRGFGVPMANWIRNELKDVFEEFLFVKNGYFNVDSIHGLYQGHISGKTDNSFKLLRIFMFNYWFEKYYKH